MFPDAVHPKGGLAALLRLLVSGKVMTFSSNAPWAPPCPDTLM